MAAIGGAEVICTTYQLRAISLSKIMRWFCCSCFIAMVGLTEVECGLTGPFGLETSRLPLCSVGAEESPVSGLSHLHRKDVLL